MFIDSNLPESRQLSEAGSGAASPPAAAPPCVPGYLERPGAGCLTLAPPPIPAASDADPNLVMGMGVLAVVAVIFIIMVIVAVVTVVKKVKREKSDERERTQKRRKSTANRDEAVAALKALGLPTEGSSKAGAAGPEAPAAAEDMAPTLEKVQSL